MKRKPLTTSRLSGYSLRGNPFRTAGLIFVVSILSFTLFGGSVLSHSLKNGLGSLKERMGADIAVVPLEHEAEYEGIILSGEPSRFYFDKSIENQLAQIEGVNRVTSQFYISTLSAACCSVPVQVIGFDPDTDFVVHPWISKVYDKEIDDGQLVVGSDIIVNETKTLTFFNKTYAVVAQLEETSTGMDYSVYANMQTVRSLVEGAREVGMNLSVDVYDADMDQSISTVLVKISSDYDVETVTTNIRRQISGIGVVQSKSIFTSISNNLDVLQAFINTLTAVLWVVAVLVLAVIFSVIFNGRKKEFALLRTLGATRGKLVRIVLAEALLISVAGGVLGTALSSMVVIPFSTKIGETLNLPYLLPAAGSVVCLAANSLVLSFAVGPIAAAYSAVKIGRAQTYVALREGE